MEKQKKLSEVLEAWDRDIQEGIDNDLHHGDTYEEAYWHAICSAGEFVAYLHRNGYEVVGKKKG